MLLRDSAYRGDASYERVIERARRFQGSNIPGEYHAEFIRLVETASRLMP